MMHALSHCQRDAVYRRHLGMRLKMSSGRYDQHRKWQHLLLCFITVFIVCWHVQAWSQITTEVDPMTVSLGETVRLTLTFDNPHTKGVPDLTPLQQDFTITGTQQMMSYQLMNGKAHALHQWTVLLIPKRVGVLLIPAIHMGHQQSTATRIEVTENTDQLSKDGSQTALQDRVMIKAAVDSSSVFVNQEIRYTVKLYNSERLMNAEYQAPHVEDALVIPLGDGRRYQESIGDRAYEVEEQQYAIFPQKKGRLSIVSPTFQALILDAVPRRIRIHDETKDVMVTPIPPQQSGKAWLPSKHVALTETYESSDTRLKQGSAVVRTVTIQAVGIPAQLIPTISFDSQSDWKTYPEAPSTQNSLRQQALIGRVDIKVTYLFSKAGHITLPEVKLPWFNTDTGKDEVAILPARTFDIDAAYGTAKSSIPASSPVKTALPNSTKASTPFKRWIGNSLGWWGLSSIVLGWILGVVIWRKRAKVFRGNTHAQRMALKHLKSACQQNNPQLVAVAMLHWAGLHWPDRQLLHVHQLGEFITDSLFKKQLLLLSEALYRPGSHNQWSGEVLWRAIDGYLCKKSVKKRKKFELPPINP